jgi:hypothetical protein
VINKLKKHQEEIPYDMVSREVVQSIENPIALAIWVYLQSQSEGWSVIESQIRKRFGIGERAYMRAMKVLKDMGLYSVTRHKDKDNKFTGCQFHIHHSPQVHLPQVWKATGVENDTYIKEEESIKEKESNKEKDSKEITKEKFKQFHKAYLGKKRGFETELKNFIKKYKDWETLVDLLVDRTFYVDVADTGFIPLMSTFINQRKWEEFQAKPERQWFELKQGIITKGSEYGLKELDFNNFQLFRAAVMEKVKSVA